MLPVFLMPSMQMMIGMAWIMSDTIGVHFDTNHYLEVVTKSTITINNKAHSPIMLQCSQVKKSICFGNEISCNAELLILQHSIFSISWFKSCFFLNNMWMRFVKNSLFIRSLETVVIKKDILRDIVEINRHCRERLWFAGGVVFRVAGRHLANEKDPNWP